MTDRRHSVQEPGEARSAAPVSGRHDAAPEGEGLNEDEVLTGEVVGEEPAAPVEEPNYLEDLLRVKAEFENYRKRVLREQTLMAQRASIRLVERLLPILDNFERAIAHGEGGPGIEMTVKELQGVLTDEGLEEISSEGLVFDPHFHDAFEVVEDANASEPVVSKVLRRGYLVKGQIIRPAMVRVARPPERSEGVSGPGLEAGEQGEQGEPGVGEGAR